MKAKKGLEELKDFLADLEMDIVDAKLENGGIMDKELAHKRGSELEKIAGDLFDQFAVNQNIDKYLLSKLDYTVNYLKHYTKWDLISFLDIAVNELLKMTFEGVK